MTGTAGTGTAPVTSGDGAGAPARRAGRRRWSDPRLLVGAVLVAASVLAVARLLGGNDDRVEVWSVRDDVRAGTVVSTDQLQPVRVALDDEPLDRYLRSEQVPADGTVWARDLAADELVAHSALAAAEDLDVVELPVAVDAAAVPPSLGTGDLVDVWVTPLEAGDARTGSADRVLQDVRVRAVDEADLTGGGAATQVLLGLPADRAGSLGEAIAAVSTGTVTLVDVS